MFDIGWTELLLIGIVALIVIGPKDLPEMFRTLGRFTAKARGMAREFSRAMEAAADESGVKDMARDIRKAADMPRSGMDAVKEAARKFETWDPLKQGKPGADKAAQDRPAPVTAVGPKPAPAAGADAPPAAAPPAAPDRPMGPATQALAEAQAARKAAAAQAAETLRAARDPGPSAPASPGPDAKGGEG